MSSKFRKYCSKIDVEMISDVTSNLYQFCNDFLAENDLKMSTRKAIFLFVFFWIWAVLGSWASLGRVRGVCVLFLGRVRAWVGVCVLFL